MSSLDAYLNDLQSRGQSTFTREEGLLALGQSEKTFSAAITRLIKKRRLVSPRRGFYLILRPEDQIAGAPDPVRWIDPLMRYLATDYRISLLRAAAFHGVSHQATMVFQVIVPKQLRSIEVGRHRVQFIYQTPTAFEKINRADWLGQMKSDTGFAKVAGIELTLLDAIRYFPKAAGLNGVAQIVHDLGAKARPSKLAKVARVYENTAIRRLGYLLEHFGYERQAKMLLPFAKKAKSMKLLNPSVKPLLKELDDSQEQNAEWMLIINDVLEIDT
jgi:predicted transcriptional regulator of viral defense system